MSIGKLVAFHSLLVPLVRVDTFHCVLFQIVVHLNAIAHRLLQCLGLSFQMFRRQLRHCVAQVVTFELRGCGCRGGNDCRRKTFHVVGLKADFRRSLVDARKPFSSSWSWKPRGTRWGEQVVLEQFSLTKKWFELVQGAGISTKFSAYLDARNCETQRLNRIACQSIALCKLNAPNVALIFLQKTQALMERRAAVMRERTEEWSLVGDFISIDCRIAAAC